MKKRKQGSTTGIDFTVGDRIEDNQGKKNIPPASREHPGLFPEFQQGGLQRAARLLLALGADEASRILREMSDEEIRVLVEEMTRVRFITAEEKRSILHEFKNMIAVEPPVPGGPEAAREVLVRSFGETKADELLGKVQRQDARRQFDFLTEYEPSLIATVLTNEHPQIAAVTLSYMKPSLAAHTIKYIADEARLDICRRLGRPIRISPDAVIKAAGTLRQKFQKRMDDFFSETGGADTLAGILSHLDRGTEEKILETLQSEEPDLFHQVRERLYTFEELVHLDARELRLLLSQVSTEIIATALRGAADEMKRATFNAVSQNRASDILDEMDHRGPISVREINDARTAILQAARQLDEEGRILIKKAREEYI